MHPSKKTATTKQKHPCHNTNSSVLFDMMLLDEALIKQSTQDREPKELDFEDIKQGSLGVFGITGRKEKTYFFVLDKTGEQGFYYTRERRGEECKTFKRRLCYQKKGLRDSLYVVGFIGRFDALEGVAL